MKVSSEQTGFRGWSVMVFLLCLTLAACGEETPKSTAPAKPPVASAPPAFPPTPAAPTAPVTEATRTTYQWYCAQCHGMKGKGNGINAPHTAVPPRDHTKPDYLETRSDEQLFHVIKFGGLAGGRAPCMPQWGHTFDDATIHSLVRYIRELCHCEAL